MVAFVPPLVALAARFVLTRAFASATAGTIADSVTGSKLANADATPDMKAPEQPAPHICTPDKPFG